MKNLVNQNVKVWNYQQDWIESIKKKKMETYFAIKILNFILLPLFVFKWATKSLLKDLASENSQENFITYSYYNNWDLVESKCFRHRK